ncbi:MAG TPA: aldehyde dehydrogenase family protein [Pyrinomonadaceae bacterium]|jgi:acyl-CoA reductase-like NAD-dependent aldehyde dehydrogenase
MPDEVRASLKDEAPSNVQRPTSNVPVHIPLIRKGEPYRSLDAQRVAHHRTRELFAEISQANVGLVRRDLLEQERSRRALAEFSVAELLEICRRAAVHFVNDVLPVGDDAQTPEDYVRQVSATTGLPFVLVRRNMEKIRGVLAEMESVLAGLTRRLDLRILDEGFGESEGEALSFYPRGASLGVVLPSNSPGVHALWIPAVALKIPLVLKPGSAEPWTPFRIIQSLVRAGAPAEAFSFYPTDHAGAAEILSRCGRSMIFGDAASTRLWQGDARVEIHGPGYSKIIFGEDTIDEWEKYLDVLVASVAENGGRSCINASSIWTPSHAAEIAEALSERLARILPRDTEDEEALLAPFADERVAARIDEGIEQALREPGARDVTASHRKTGRLVSFQGCSYLLPTVVHCRTPEHPLANREYLFPFTSVVEVEQARIPEALGRSLVVTAITADRELISRLVSSPHVDRLNLGAVPTTRVSWNQPHEGNLFEHLYARRAFQRALSTSAA